MTILYRNCMKIVALGTSDLSLFHSNLRTFLIGKNNLRLLYIIPSTRHQLLLPPSSSTTNKIKNNNFLISAETSPSVSGSNNNLK